MNLEGIADPPPRQRPEVRYATLHRSIERGLAGERAWAELVSVCAELGRREEASSALRRVKSPSLRSHAVTRARAHGMRLDAAPAGGAVASSSSLRIEDSRMPVMEHLGEAIRYLFVDHMPLTLIVTTITFPVLIGVGGFLRSSLPDSAAIAAAVLTAVPVLMVLGLLGHLSRETLRDSRRGLIDPPGIPHNRALARGAGRFATDSLAVVAALATPVVLASFALPTIATVILGLGAFLIFPLVAALRMTEGTWRCFDPRHVFRTVSGYLPAFASASLCSLLLFAPAILTVILTRESSLDLCLSVAGSLAAVPMVLSARLLGQVLQERDKSERARLAALAREAQVAREMEVIEEQTAPRRRRRTAEQRTKASQERRAVREQKPRKQREAEVAEETPAQPRKRKTTVKRKTKVKRKTEVVGTSKAAPQATASTSRHGLGDQPDLSAIPGATIVRRR